MGAGSWGTTLAKVFADAGSTVTIWARRPQIADTINTYHHNPDYLPGIQLPTTLTATTNPTHALCGATIVVLAVPSQTLRDNLATWAPHIPTDATLVSLAKGIETDTFLRMSQVIADVAGADPSRIAVLSGPNLAKEIALQQPAATVIACTDDRRAKQVQAAVGAPYFRPYTNTDVIGAEIGGACKNVIALACGMASGNGLGENTLASLITRGLAEITRLGTTMGADPRTFAGLAGQKPHLRLPTRPRRHPRRSHPSNQRPSRRRRHLLRRHQRPRPHPQRRNAHHPGSLRRMPPRTRRQRHGGSTHGPHQKIRITPEENPR